MPRLRSQLSTTLRTVSAPALELLSVVLGETFYRLVNSTDRMTINASGDRLTHG